MLDHSPGYRLAARQGELDHAGYYRVSDYELVTGWIAGYEPTRTYLGPSAGSPRAGFEQVLLPALRRHPCVVAFSGGRDSSAVLAVATHLARREGLPDPVPVTLDFTGNARADESAYQESLVRDLRLRDWQRLRNPDSCEILGPSARRGLLRHGLLWPATVHSTESMIALAAGGGSLVTGQGGDEVLGPHRLTALNRLVSGHHAWPRQMRSLIKGLAPLPLRRHRALRKVRSHGDPFAYLPPALGAEAATRIARDQVEVPLTFNRAVLRAASSRAATAAATNFRRLCAESDVTYHEPFLDPAFLAPLAGAGGVLGWTGRAAAMRALFGDVLSEGICTRTDKAEFSQVTVGECTRGFLAGWTGTGLDENVVDIEKFRALATAARPPSTVLLLIQEAWLASEGRRPEQATAEAAVRP